MAGDDDAAATVPLDVRETGRLIGPMQKDTPRSDRGEVRAETLIKIATLYYYEDVTQEVLSQRFGMSRAKISRLLRRAREEGLVEIRVHQPSSVGAEFGREFIRRFNIARLLVSVDHRDPDTQRGAVARLVAGHLERSLSDGATGRARCPPGPSARSAGGATGRRGPTPWCCRRAAASPSCAPSAARCAPAST